MGLREIEVEWGSHPRALSQTPRRQITTHSDILHVFVDWRFGEAGPEVKRAPRYIGICRAVSRHVALRRAVLRCVALRRAVLCCVAPCRTGLRRVAPPKSAL